MHVTNVYFIQLAHKVKYDEFEDRPTNFFYKNLLKCEIFFCQKTDKRMSYQKNWRIQTLDDFLWKLRTTGSIERTVMIDFKMWCLYIVLVLQGNVETV